MRALNKGRVKRWRKKGLNNIIRRDSDDNLWQALVLWDFSQVPHWTLLTGQGAPLLSQHPVPSPVPWRVQLPRSSLQTREGGGTCVITS